MKEQNDKYAFFSIDVERFVDTECVYKSKQPIEETMLDGLDRYISILDTHNIKATLFVLSEVAEIISEKLKKYISNGHKIALHGKRHVPPNLIKDSQFEEQIISAKEKLETMLDTTISGYRAPCFSLSRDKLDILKRLGFAYDSSWLDFAPARHTKQIDLNDYNYLGGEVYEKDNFFEFGISVGKIFGKKFPVSGGGYIRISNWLFAKHLVKKYIRNNNYYVFYSHPFEFSREKQPKIKKLKLYDKMYLKFGKLLYPYKIEYIIKKLKENGYTFTTFEEISKSEESNMVNKKGDVC